MESVCWRAYVDRRFIRWNSRSSESVTLETYRSYEQRTKCKSITVSWGQAEHEATRDDAAAAELWTQLLEPTDFFERYDAYLAVNILGDPIGHPKQRPMRRYRL